jgi:hypothetical protein
MPERFTVMFTRFAASHDQNQIPYDVCDSGPAIMLLHGGGSLRQEWHETGEERHRNR